MVVTHRLPAVGKFVSELAVLVLALAETACDAYVD